MEVYEQVPNDSSVLGNAIMKALEKYVCGVICQKTFLILSWFKILNFQGFICYQKITNGCMVFLADQLFRFFLIGIHSLQG